MSNSLGSPSCSNPLGSTPALPLGSWPGAPAPPLPTPRPPVSHTHCCSFPRALSLPKVGALSPLPSITTTAPFLCPSTQPRALLETQLPSILDVVPKLLLKWPCRPLCRTAPTGHGTCWAGPPGVPGASPVPDVVSPSLARAWYAWALPPF